MKKFNKFPLYGEHITEVSDSTGNILVEDKNLEAFKASPDFECDCVNIVRNQGDDLTDKWYVWKP